MPHKRAHRNRKPKQRTSAQVAYATTPSSSPATDPAAAAIGTMANALVTVKRESWAHEEKMEKVKGDNALVASVASAFVTALAN